VSTPTLNEIERLLDDLSREEQLRLIETIVRRLQRQGTRAQGAPKSLYGLLKDPALRALDIDAALPEIRAEWKRELEDPEA
jgi:hypothetical protein